MTKPKTKNVNDFSRCLDPLDMDAKLIAVIEMSQSSWLVAGWSAIVFEKCETTWRIAI